MRASERVVNLLRVGVTNNFNFTENELAELEDLGWDPKKLFVNSNSFITVKPPYPVILTVNPYLNMFVEPKGDLTNLKACRVKYIYDAKNPKPVEESVGWCAENSVPVLVTFMRFCKKSSVEYWTRQGKGYAFNRSYYRLTKEGLEASLADINEIASRCNLSDDLLHFCDVAGEGCPTCLNCAKLAFPDLHDVNVQIYGVSLKSSGDNGRCLFHCPDCWAQRLLKGCRGGAYGVVTQNSKQKGHISH